MKVWSSVWVFFAGAVIFIELELPTETAAHEEKKLKSKEVDSAVEYLKTIFWHYANDKENYNFTRETFRDQVKGIWFDETLLFYVYVCMYVCMWLFQEIG